MVKQITISPENYNIIIDALELMESKVTSKMEKTIETKKRRKLRDLQLSLCELINDLVDDENELNVASMN